MIRKSMLYAAGKYGWVLLMIGVAAATYLGLTDGPLPASAIPGPTWLPVIPALVAGALGWGALTVLETRSWVSAGSRADLAPSGGGGIVRKPELAGKVRGRPVRVYTREKKVKSGDNRSKKTFTVVEADMDEATETGLVIGRGDGSGIASMGVDVGGGASAHSVGNYAGMGSSQELIESVLTERTRRALDDVADLEMVFVGDVSNALPDLGSGFGGSMLEAAFSMSMPGDASTVVTETKGLVLDGDELRARVQALAAVADAAEEARTDDEWGASEFGQIEEES